MVKKKNQSHFYAKKKFEKTLVGQKEEMNKQLNKRKTVIY